MVDRIQGLLDRVPGYSGYRDKERRRDEDKRVRVAVAESIGQIASGVQDAGRTLADARQLQDIQAVEALYQRTTLLENRIRNATYGYAGLFDDVKVDEAALDQLARFDRQMGKELTALDGAASAVQAAGTDPGAIGQALANANGELTRLETLWNGRAAVIATGRPTSDQKALDLLDAASAPPTPAAPAPPQVLPGAALAILGDNFIVDLTMVVTGSDETLNLARIGPGDWLLQASGKAEVVARLKESGQAPAGQTAGSPGRCVITGKDGSSQTAAVTYALVTAGDAISAQIGFSDETRSFSGNKIAADDVEIFGQPAR